ncbi:MAG: hypothetical protein DRR19_31545 [Candidatus Parabeggiatoa sp. nov. 1]|nr:MAG: hypothetical protein DRR19_31545 [Gammaproteobacteria bacterium]
MTKIELLFLTILIALIALIFYFNIHLLSGSSLQHPLALAYELAGNSFNEPSRQWINQWMWEQGSPFKFRILGKLPVWLTYQAFDSPTADAALIFYNSFIFWGFVWMSATLITLYFYLKMLFKALPSTQPHHLTLSFIGCLLFLTAPPILAGFKFPVHTAPNDLLGYFLILLGVIMILKNKPIAMCIIASIAVFCRETTLIVPFLYLITSRDTLKNRAFFSLFPVVVWVCYRVVGWEHYSASSGAQHNFEYPYETMAFLFLVFGFLWIFSIMGFLELRKTLGANGDMWNMLAKAFPWIIALVLCINLFLARIREIRISFIIFFLIIPFAVAWVVKNTQTIKKTFQNKWFWLYILVTTFIVIRFRILMMPISSQEHLQYLSKWAHFYDGFGGGWLNIFPFYLFIALITIPIIIIKLGNRFTRKR